MNNSCVLFLYLLLSCLMIAFISSTAFPAFSSSICTRACSFSACMYNQQHAQVERLAHKECTVASLKGMVVVLCSYGA